MFQDLADNKEHPEKWDKFYEAFSTSLKLGILHDSQNKTRLSKLLRFHSAKNGEKKISLEEYIEKMKKGQEVIYYLGGETLESVQNSPLLEGLTKRGYDVLLLPDPIDEYCISSLGKYDGKFAFTDISKEGLKLSASEEEKLKNLNEDFSPLTEYLKAVLSDKVSKVQVSNKLAKVPCVIVSQSWGYSANMERIMKAQALKDDRHSAHLSGKRVLEINPRHPIIKRLLELVQTDNTDNTTDDVANVLYDTAVLNSGYSVTNPSELTGRLNKMVASVMDVDPNEEAEEELFEEEFEAEAENLEEEIIEPEELNEYEEL